MLVYSWITVLSVVVVFCAIFLTVCLQDADKAANQVTTLNVFKSAQVVKINPDKPQEQARFNTLEVIAY